MTTKPTAAMVHTTGSTRALDVARLRADFAILQIEIDGKPLVYLDTAASSQMLQPVIDRLVRYQTSEHANINRAVQGFLVPAMSRASFAFYNSMAKVDALIAGIRTMQRVFA